MRNGARCRRLDEQPSALRPDITRFKPRDSPPLFPTLPPMSPAVTRLLLTPSTRSSQHRATKTAQ